MGCKFQHHHVVSLARYSCHLLAFYTAVLGGEVSEPQQNVECTFTNRAHRSKALCNLGINTNESGVCSYNLQTLSVVLLQQQLQLYFIRMFRFRPRARQAMIEYNRGISGGVIISQTFAQRDHLWIYKSCRGYFSLIVMHWRRREFHHSDGVSTCSDVLWLLRSALCAEPEALLLGHLYCGYLWIRAALPWLVHTGCGT